MVDGNLSVVNIKAIAVRRPAVVMAKAVNLIVVGMVS